MAGATRVEHRIPPSLDELEDAYASWLTVHDELEDYVAGCVDDCERARSLKAEAADEIATILHLAILAPPDPTRAFPASALALAQASPELAAAVDVEASMRRLVARWTSYWSRRAKLGMCVFSAQPEDRPAFSFGPDCKKLYVRCAGVDRSDNTQLVLLTRAHPAQGYNFVVRRYSAQAPIELATSVVRDEVSQSARLKSWRFAVVAIQDAASTHGVAVLDLDP